MINATSGVPVTMETEIISQGQAVRPCETLR